MEAKAYEDMASVQSRHWWYRARRTILADYIASLGLSPGSALLEVGCGTGGNIGMLEEYGYVTAVERDDFARESAIDLTGIEVVNDQLPELASIGKKFDLLCLFDVLEHVEQDRESLIKLKSLLKPGGTLLITVPAYQWLYGRHDEVLHHHRRYRRSKLAGMLTEVGYRVSYASYFNSILFPIVAITRTIELISKPEVPLGSKMPGRLPNALLYHVFKIERLILRLIRIPFGTSILVSARVDSDSRQT